MMIFIKSLTDYKILHYDDITYEAWKEANVSDS